MPPKKRVLISGTGVAGALCALLLDPEKYEVSLIERAPSYRNIGFSICLWKTGFDELMSALSANGAQLVEEKDYFRAESFLLFAGSKLGTMKELDSDGYAWAFERAHLMEALEQALDRRQFAERISFDKTVRSIENSETEVMVTLSDGTKAPYDFLIVAEGISSTSRNLVPIYTEILSTGFSLRYAWVHPDTALGKKGALFFTKGHLGVIHPPYFKNLLGFYFKKGLSESIQRDFEALAAKHIPAQQGSTPAFDLDTSRVFELEEVHMDSYHFMRTVFVGDAAHGHPPTIGFGTSMAVEDAVVLCRKLNDLPDASSESIDRAFQAYTRVRKERIRSVYRFQKIVHLFITENPIKIAVFAFAAKLFLGKIIERKVKSLASFKVR